MKKIVFTFLLLGCLYVNAQIKSGIIKYEMVTSLANAAQSSDREIPEAILAMIPKEVRKSKQLRFNEGKSIFENVIAKKDDGKEEDEPQENGGGLNLKFKSIGSGDGEKEKTYIDHIANQQVELKEFFGKEFLVTTDNISKTQWKPTGKQKLLLNYPCYEAVTMGDVRGKQDTITAWYTTSIATKAGPMGFCNLPGMILQLSMGQTITITATEIIEKELKDAEIEKPKDGKKVTAAEFKEIQEKKLKEMGIERGKPRMIFHSSTDVQ